MALQIQILYGYRATIVLSKNSSFERQNTEIVEMNKNLKSWLQTLVKLCIIAKKTICIN